MEFLKKIKLLNIIILVVIVAVLILGILLWTKAVSLEVITGIDNYDKNHYVNTYGSDLDSNLSLFPDSNIDFVDAEFISSLSLGLFDTDGYIVLKTKYTKNTFDSEIGRLKDLKATVKNSCKGNAMKYTNTVLYDTISYDLPAYITIDGFANTYEYALIDEGKLEIVYVYLTHPHLDNNDYAEYLKKDKSWYKKQNTSDMFSMYNHSFDNGKSYAEFDDC